MNKKTLILLISSIVLLVVALFIFIYAKLQNKPITNIADVPIKTAPEEIIDEFYFYDKDNNKFKMSDFSDKPIALILWRSDAENSLKTIELLDTIYENYKNDINFLVVNTNEPDKNIIESVEGCDFIIPIYYDTENIASNYYTFKNLPSFIFIDKNGELSNQTEGTITEDKLTANLDIIAENY